MVEQSKWVEITTADPEHSNRYIERFRTMEAAGHDIGGEARFIDALAPRQARILDAGCGPGRVGGRLHRCGHTVVGVDVDPVLIAAAEDDHPGPTWLVGDLAELDLPSSGIADPFDVVVCAGNVMTFLAPSTRRQVLGRLGDHLAADGRLVVGFGSGRGYPFDEYRTDAAAARLVIDLELATWHLHPFHPDADFHVTVLHRS